jgi:cell division protein FtsB
MDEFQSESQHEDKLDQNRSNKPKKDRRQFKQVLVFLLVLLLLGASTYAGFWYRGQQADKDVKDKQSQIDKLNQEKADLQHQLNEANAEDDTTDEATKTKPSASDLENIQASITSGNTAALEGYMAKKVTVILAASECCGSRTPTQAINDIKYLEGATDPWNFDLPQATLDNYAAGDYAQYFPDDALVGKSANNYVVSFTFDAQGDINGVFMTGNSNVL